MTEIKIASSKDITNLIWDLENGNMQIVPSNSTKEERRQIGLFIKRHKKNKRFRKRLKFMSSSYEERIKIIQKEYNHQLWLKKIRSSVEI